MIQKFLLGLITELFVKLAAWLKLETKKVETSNATEKLKGAQTPEEIANAAADLRKGFE